MLPQQPFQICTNEGVTKLSIKTWSKDGWSHDQDSCDSAIEVKNGQNEEGNQSAANSFEENTEYWNQLSKARTRTSALQWAELAIQINSIQDHGNNMHARTHDAILNHMQNKQKSEIQ